MRREDSVLQITPVIANVLCVKMGRKGKDTSIELRQLVIHHKEKGKSYREMVKLLNISKNTIADIILLRIYS